MTTRVSVAVMAHPKRAAMVEELVASLDRDPVVVWDRRNDEWETGSRAIRAYDSDATHLLVLQDDSLVCRDLVAGCEVACAESGDHPVSLYTGQRRPAQAEVDRRLSHAKQEGASWVSMPGPRWGVAIVLPTSCIPDLLAWSERNTAYPYDRRIAVWFNLQRLWCWHTVPSLVEHRHGTENPSLLPGHDDTSRRAWEWIGPYGSALDIDWTRGPVEAPGDGYYEVPRGRMGTYFTCWDCGFKLVSKDRMTSHREKCGTRAGTRR